MLSPERQERCEALLRGGLAEVTAAVLALAATQPALALEAYGALGEAVAPYLKGDPRAGSIAVRITTAERLARRL